MTQGLYRWNADLPHFEINGAKPIEAGNALELAMKKEPGFFAYLLDCRVYDGNIGKTK
jgi:hypothetical protein